MKKLSQLNLFEYFIKFLKTYLILLLPFSVYVINHFILYPIPKIICSLAIFFIYFGYEGLRFLLSYLNLKTSSQTLKLNIFQLISFSILIGLTLNIIYGIIAMVFGIYDLSIFYIFFYEIIAILFFIRKKSSKSFPIYKAFDRSRIKEIGFLLILFIPIVWKIFFEFYFMPFPYYSSWDLFSYQYHTSEILQNNIRFLYGDLDLFTQEMLRPTGFSIIQANIVLSSVINFYFLFEFNKIGYILTLFLTSIWIFLITLKMTKNNTISLAVSLFISPIQGYGMITPQHYLPAAFSWQIGFALIYFLLIYFSQNNFNKKLFRILFLFLIFLLFSFHFFTSVIMSLCLIIIYFLKTKRLQKYNFLLGVILLFELVFFYIGNTFEIPILSNFSNLVFGTSNIPSIESKIHTLNDIFSLSLICLSIIGSVYLIIIKTNKNYNWIGFGFLFFLLLYFGPFPATFRMIYIIIIYSFFIYAILLLKIKNFSLQLIKELNNSNLKKNKLKIRFMGISTIFLLLLSISFNFNIPKINENNFIVDNELNRIYKSIFSLNEFYTALWIYNEIDIKSSIAVTDPGTGLIYSGIVGLFYYKFLYLWNDFRNIFINCSEEGIDMEGLEDILKELNNDYLGGTAKIMNHLLIFTPRTHIIIQTNDLSYKYGHYDKSWINYTLLQYIENTTGIENIYYNEEVYIFSVNFSIS